MGSKVMICVALLGLLGGCGYSPRNNPPTSTWILKAPLDKAATCVITGLNAQFPASFGTYAITHAAQIVSPGSIYEIAPQQNIAPVHAESYFIRLTAQGPNTKAELFSTESAGGVLSKGVTQCEASLSGA